MKDFILGSDEFIITATEHIHSRLVNLGLWEMLDNLYPKTIDQMTTKMTNHKTQGATNTLFVRFVPLFVESIGRVEYHQIFPLLFYCSQEGT